MIIKRLDDGHRRYIDGLVQDYSIAIANSLEILQSCIKPSRCERYFTTFEFTMRSVWLSYTETIPSG